jgi:hypothetical protein
MKFRLEYNIQGILYKSVKNQGGLCAVLFTDNQQMVELADSAGAHENEILALVEDSIATELVL